MQVHFMLFFFFKECNMIDGILTAYGHTVPKPTVTTMVMSGQISSVLSIFVSHQLSPEILADLPAKSNQGVIYGTHFTKTLSAHNWNLAWWRHQMETFTKLLALCVGNSPVTGTGASDAELWCFLWSAPEQTVERATEMPVIYDYYDVIVMVKISSAVILMWIIQSGHNVACITHNKILTLLLFTFECKSNTYMFTWFGIWAHKPRMKGVLNNKIDMFITSWLPGEDTGISGMEGLTHLPLDKMAAISQTIFSKVFLWMENCVFWLKFHWSLFPRVQLEQLECLRSEDTPAASWLPILLSHIGSQVKRQSQSYKFKEFAKISNFEEKKSITHDTLSEVAW